MEKTNKEGWIVSGLLVIALAIGLLTFLGVKAPVQTAYASPISANNVYYYDDIEHEEKTFAEELPAGYTFSDGVLTVGSTSTHDYQIWTDGDGDLTIVFERDYGGDANYNSSNYNDIFIDVTANSGILTLTSTSNVNVTLAGLGSSSKLYVLGKVNLNIIGPDYAGSMTGRYGSCLVYCGGNMYVEGNASFTAKDPNLHERTKTNSEYAIVKLGCLVLNTTGCFKAGLYETSTTTDVAYALNIIDGGYISYSKCDNGFVLYANSSSKFIDAYDYYVGDEYLTIEENDEGKRELTIRECIISFNANGGSGEMENELKTKGNYTLPSCTFTPPSGKQFLCWAKNSTTGTQYNSGTQYNVNDDVTFYAIWEENAHEHSMQAYVENPATCTATGNSAYWYCTGCEKYFSDAEGNTEITLEATVISATGHTPSDWQITVPATCTAAGSKHKFCTVCEAELEVEEIPVIDHTPGEWEIVIPATCTEPGTEHKICIVCGIELDAEAIDTTDHTPGEWIITTPATCTEPGSKHKICTVCEAELEVEAIAASGHNYEESITVPTCLDQGYTTHTCSRCADSYVDTYVNALGHIEVTDAAVSPTCTATGLTEGKHCSRCETILVKQAVVNALGHIEVTDAAVSPTCTATGLTEGKHCSRCETILVKQAVVNALGHNFGDWAVTKEAQPGVKGEGTRTCARCGATEKREIAALPYVPTTTDDGEKVYNETVTEEAKDVTELFKQAKAEEGTVEIKATTENNKEIAIVFDNNAVKAIGDANVTISAKVSTENLTVENAELVFEVTVAGATFENGKATVAIPFEKEVPAGKVGKVYYIDDQGNKTDMNATFENGKVIFTTNHFSTYAVMFEDASVITPEKAGLSGGAIAGIVIGCFFGLLLIACVVLFLLHKKGIVNIPFLKK